MTKYGTRNGVNTVKKLIVNDKIPVDYTIPDTVALSTTALLSGFDLNAHGTANITATSLTAQPPYAMVLSIQAVNTGAIDDGNELKIKGYDAKGNLIEEDIVISSVAFGVNYTSNAFAKINSMVANEESGCTDLNLGLINRIGLPYPIATSDDILCYNYGGSTATTAPYGTVDSTYDVIYHDAIGVSSTLKVLYKTKLQK